LLGCFWLGHWPSPVLGRPAPCCRVWFCHLGGTGGAARDRHKAVGPSPPRGGAAEGRSSRLLRSAGGVCSALGRQPEDCLASPAEVGFRPPGALFLGGTGGLVPRWGRGCSLWCGGRPSSALWHGSVEHRGIVSSAGLAPAFGHQPSRGLAPAFGHQPYPRARLLGGWVGGPKIAIRPSGPSPPAGGRRGGSVLAVTAVCRRALPCTGQPCRSGH